MRAVLCFSSYSAGLVDSACPSCSDGSSSDSPVHHAMQNSLTTPPRHARGLVVKVGNKTRTLHTNNANSPLRTKRYLGNFRARDNEALRYSFCGRPCKIEQCGHVVRHEARICMIFFHSKVGLCTLSCELTVLIYDNNHRSKTRKMQGSRSTAMNESVAPSLCPVVHTLWLNFPFALPPFRTNRSSLSPFLPSAAFFGRCAKNVTGSGYSAWRIQGNRPGPVTRTTHLAEMPTLKRLERGTQRLLVAHSSMPGGKLWQSLLRTAARSPCVSYLLLQRFPTGRRSGLLALSQASSLCKTGFTITSVSDALEIMKVVTMYNRVTQLGGRPWHRRSTNYDECTYLYRCDRSSFYPPASPHAP